MGENGVELLERTYELVRGPVALLDETMLERPTPCARWTAGELVDHLVDAINMFASATGASPVTEDDGLPLVRFEAAARRSLAAWRDTGEDTSIPLPFGVFPAPVARGINQLDSLVHGWDLAAALGIPFEIPDDLAEAALTTAQISVPPSRGHVFDVEVEPPTERPADRLIAFTGRDPSAWTGAVWLGGSLVTLKAPGDSSTGRPSAVEIWEREGSGPPVHLHDAHDELWYVLEGSFTFQLGTHQLTATAGEAVVGPRGVPHTFRADSPRSRLLDIHTPGGFEAFFIKAGQPARHLAPPTAVGAAAPQAMLAAMEHFGARVVGPPLNH
jgi:uncharacterized protein (TIGR03086 family)